MSRLNIGRWRTRIGWLLAPLFFLAARPSVPLLVVGLVLALAGLGMRAWAAGTIRKKVELATVGPYAHTRNPLYFGTFLLGTGLALAGGRWFFVAAFLLFFVAIYGATMRGEAEWLEREFGDDYRRYADHVPLFLPRPTPWRGGTERSGFDVGRYRGNKEYEAALGALAGFLVLAAKMIWW